MAVRTVHMASGVHTEIQHPERLASQTRLGWGLNVEQASNGTSPTENWFHLGVPYIQSDRRESGGQIRNVYLNIELNENARLAIIRLRENRRLVWELRPNILGRTIDQDFLLNQPNLGLGTARWALTIEMNIEFLTGAPTGSVTFLGGGLEVITSDLDS